jgi:hypothetical protein
VLNLRTEPLAPLAGPGQVDAGDGDVVGKGLPAGHYAQQTVTRGAGITGREFTDRPGELLEASVDRLSPPLDQPAARSRTKVTQLSGS